MKRIITLLICFTIGQNAFATEWAWYYVYIQTDYMQGPWTRSQILYDRNSAYLHPIQFEDLFGLSDEAGLVNTILKHLKEEDPPRYKFHATLSVDKDTVVIKTKDTIPDFDAVKNELIASYVLNHFAAVKIIQKNKTDVFQLKDISVPYMDLVLPNQKTLSSTEMPEAPPENKKDTVSNIPTAAITSEQHECKNDGTNSWLIVSIALNILLIGWFLIRRKNVNAK